MARCSTMQPSMEKICWSDRSMASELKFMAWMPMSIMSLSTCLLAKTWGAFLQMLV